MLSEAERRVLAEIELPLRTEDAKFAARFAGCLAIVAAFWRATKRRGRWTS